MSECNCVPRVLVVDDDVDERETTQRNLAPLRYEVYSAEGAGRALLEDAAEKAHLHRCHVAVVDMRLIDPNRDDRSGLDLIPRLAPARCVVLTAYPSHEVAIQAVKEAGAFDFASKADGPKRLRELVEAAVGEGRNCALSVHWPEQWPLQRIHRALELQEAGAPWDELPCLLGQLFSEFEELHLETIEGRVTTPISSSRRARSIVFKARGRRADRPTFDEPVVLKLAPPASIRREIESYQQFVIGQIPAARATRLEAADLAWDLGGIVYTFLGSSVDKMARFDEYYELESSSREIVKPLRRLFKTSLRNWFNSASSPTVREVFALYDDALELHERLQRYENQQRHVAVPGLLFRLRNPVVWAEDHARASTLANVRTCTTHGDLHALNVFVDRHRTSWLIDFEWTGEGHILRDIAEMEADIKLRLLKLPPDQEKRLMYTLEVALLRPESPEKKLKLPAVIREQAELCKVFGVVSGLRAVAYKVASFQDMREYYWALLCDSLFVATHRRLPEQTQERALLSAALVCERLARWGERWPPMEWSEFTSPQSPGESKEGSDDDTGQ